MELTQHRYAIEHLLSNRIPRAAVEEEAGGVGRSSLAESGGLGLMELFPPREHLATGIIAISINGLGKGDEMLQHQRSPIRSAGLSQSITTAASASSAASSHRSREATVLADAVRRLNKRICLIDQLAAGEAVGAERGLASRLALPLVKVHSVGNCIAYAHLDVGGKDAANQLAAFGVLLVQLFEEAEPPPQPEVEAESEEEGLTCRLQIGLHIGPTICGVVEGPQFLLLHETLDFALRLATTVPPNPIDRSILLASTDFIGRRGVQSLSGAQAVGLNAGSEVFLWANESSQIPRLINAMRPVLNATIQPPVVRNRVSCTDYF